MAHYDATAELPSWCDLETYNLKPLYGPDSQNHYGLVDTTVKCEECFERFTNPLAFKAHLPQCVLQGCKMLLEGLKAENEELCRQQGWDM
jgi:hypothetical protein